MEYAFLPTWLGADTLTRTRIAFGAIRQRPCVSCVALIDCFVFVVVNFFFRLIFVENGEMNEMHENAVARTVDN